MRVELPDGQWAELYDPTKVPERKRRPVVRALVELAKEQALHGFGPEVDAASLTDEDKAAALAAKFDTSVLVAGDNLNDVAVIALVSSWSFGEVTVDVLLDLPAESYKALSEACAPLMMALMPNFQVSPDPKATTGS